MMSCISPCTSSTNPSSCDSQPTNGGCDTVPGTSSFHAKTTINGGSVTGANMHQQVPSVEGMSSSSASPAVARSVPPSEPHYPESSANIVYLTTEMANQAALDYELGKFDNILEWLKTYKDSSDKENAPKPSSPAVQKPILQSMLIPEKKAVKRMREEDEQEEIERAPKKPALDDQSDYKIHEMTSFNKEEIAPVLPPMDENPLKRMERLTSSSNFSQPSTLSEVMEVPKKDDRCSKQDKEREIMNAQMMEQQQRMFQHQQQQQHQQQMAMMAAHQAAKASPNPNQPQFAMQMGPYGPMPPGAMPPHHGGPYPPQFMMNQHAARMMTAGQMGKGSPGAFPMMSPHHAMHPMHGHPAFRPGMPPMQPGMPSPQQQQQMMAHYMHMRGIPPHAMNGVPPGHPMYGAPGMPSGPMGQMVPMGMPGAPGFPGHLPRASSAAMASPSLAPRPASSSMGPGAPNSVPTNQPMMSPYHGMVPPGGIPYPHQMNPGQRTPGPGPSAPVNIPPGDAMHTGMPGTGTPITGPNYPQPIPGQMHTPSSGPGFPGGPGSHAHMQAMGQHPGMLQAAPPMHSSQVRPGESFPQYQWPQHFADNNAL